MVNAPTYYICIINPCKKGKFKRGHKYTPPLRISDPEVKGQGNTEALLVTVHDILNLRSKVKVIQR